MSDAGFDALEEQLQKVLASNRHPLPLTTFVEIIRRAGFSAVPSSSYVERLAAAASASRWRAGPMVSLLLLESEGLLAPEHSEHFVRGVLNLSDDEMRTYLFANSEPFVSSLVWRLFEVGGGGEASLANCDKFFAPTWAESFARHTAAGVLPRDRVLRSCLEALGRGFGAYVSGWYSRLYADLEPTIDEVAADEARLRVLLTSSVSASVTLAVHQLARLANAGRLDGDAFVSALPTLGSATYANARVALDLAISIGDERQDEAQRVRAVVRSALEHRDARIQKSATRWLLAHDAAVDVEDAASLLAPSVAADAGIGRIVSVPATDTQRLWGSFVPVAQQDLAEHLAALLEDSTDPLAVEAALQALALSTDRAALRSLEKRARRIATRDTWEVDFRQWVAVLILASLGERVSFGGRRQSMPPFIAARFDELALRLLAGLAGRQLLATPDDTAGRILPSTLEARLSAALDSGVTIGHVDATAALLRLDARQLHVPAARESELWQAFSYALGGPAGRIRTAAWWVAAARARDAHGPSAELAAARLNLGGQGAPVDTRLRVTLSKHQYGTSAAFALVSDAPAPPRGARIADQPTVLPARTIDSDDWFDEATTRFAGLVWPASTEYAASVGLNQVANASSSDWVTPGAAGALASLQATPAALGHLGRSALALGLSAKDAMQRTISSEIVAECLGSRTTAADLAMSMANVAGAVKAVRWRGSLEDAASISTAASARVLDLLQRLLPLLDREFNGIGGLIDLLHEQRIRMGEVSLSDELRAWLSGFAGSGKAAKTAAAIVRLAQ